MSNNLEKLNEEISQVNREQKIKTQQLDWNYQKKEEIASERINKIHELGLAEK